MEIEMECVDIVHVNYVKTGRGGRYNISSWQDEAVDTIKGL